MECHLHDLEDADVTVLRKSLLSWYDENKRDLPWRQKAKTVKDADERSYAVWVSEVMCQQTQVATVIDYYNRWMTKWPTVESLAKATLEEVNEMWSGLGYYSRGRRLWEAARKVVAELDGNMPATAADLQKLLPGVGRYTSCAIASISFSEGVGVVDGNVIRVLSRVRAIGAESQQPSVMDKFWSLADQAVDRDRPGDCNQAMMELGATVCSPKTPSCATCPLQSVCKAHQMIKADRSSSCQKFFSLGTGTEDKASQDTERGAECKLCLPADQWDLSAGVCNFPRKAKKKAPLKEEYVTAVVSRRTASGRKEYLLAKRHNEGLLAGLWEFPCVLADSPSLSLKASQQLLTAHLEEGLGVNLRGVKGTSLGEVSHTFSHRLHTYRVHSFQLTAVRTEGSRTAPCKGADQQSTQWLEDINTAGISTAVRKIMALVASSASDEASSTAKTVKRKGASSDSTGGGKAKRAKSSATLDAFVKKEKRA